MLLTQLCGERERERERLFIKLLLFFLCARILILNAAATFLLALANERVFVHFS